MSKTVLSTTLGRLSLATTLACGLLVGCDQAPKSATPPPDAVAPKAAAKPEMPVPPPPPPAKQPAQNTANKPVKPKSPDKKNADSPPQFSVNKGTDASSPVKSTRVRTRVPLSVQASEADILESIAKTANIFDYYDLTREVGKNGTQAQAIADAMAKKWQGLEVVYPPKTITKGLDFLAIDMAPAADEKCVFSVLLKCTAPLEEDYQVAISGKVKPGDESHLSEIAQKRNTPEIWRVRTWDAEKSAWVDSINMTKWTPGEYYMLQCRRRCAPIAYDLSVVLQQTDAGRWVANVGKAIKAGWHTAAKNK